MTPYIEVIAWYIFYIALSLFGLEWYYQGDGGHGLIPLLVSIGMTVMVTVLTILAFYEIFHHRHDKERW